MLFSYVLYCSISLAVFWGGVWMGGSGTSSSSTSPSSYSSSFSFTRFSLPILPLLVAFSRPKTQHLPDDDGFFSRLVFVPSLFSHFRFITYSHSYIQFLHRLLSIAVTIFLVSSKWTHLTKWNRNVTNVKLKRIQYFKEEEEEKKNRRPTSWK